MKTASKIDSFTAVFGIEVRVDASRVKYMITGLYSHTHAHTCIATQVYDLKSGYVGGPGLLKSRV